MIIAIHLNKKKTNQKLNGPECVEENFFNIFLATKDEILWNYIIFFLNLEWIDILSVDFVVFLTWCMETIVDEHGFDSALTHTFTIRYSVRYFDHALNDKGLNTRKFSEEISNAAKLYTIAYSRRREEKLVESKPHGLVRLVVEINFTLFRIVWAFNNNNYF